MRSIAASVFVVALAILFVASATATASPAQEPTQVYRIREGDTLWSLARRFDTRPERLAALNRISVESTLSIGQALKVPAGNGSALQTAAPVVRQATQMHRVRQGDTLWSMSRRYGATPEHLAAMNGISTDAILPLGKTLKVPANRAGGASTGGPVTAEAVSGAARGRLAALPSRGEQWTSSLLTLSKRYLGTRYRWGGTTPAGFDCSGFIYYVYGRMGVALPRTTFQMFEAGVSVPRDALSPGDILFFHTIRPGASHAGIYLGDDRFAHASSSARRVLITSMDDDYYAARYLGARRF